MIYRKRLREHFAKMRQADDIAGVHFHANILYGYTLALHEMGVMDHSVYDRINAIVSKAWTMRIGRINRLRRVA